MTVSFDHTAKKYSLLYIALIFIFVFPFNLLSKNLYVDVLKGNDSWDGLFSTFQSGNSGPLKSIQKAIDLSSINDKIIIAEGVYRENILISHQLILSGKGSGKDSTQNTIIQSKNYLVGMGINISYSAGNPLLATHISNLRITGFETGFVLARDIILKNIEVTDNKYGFQNGSNNFLRDLTMTKCKASFNQIAALQINHSCNVIAFIVDSCEFSDNFGGIYTYCNNPANSNVIDFLLKNSSFKRNRQKAIYAEKLDNSIFENLFFDSCGIDTNYSFNAAIDINLKFNNYSNIFIKNSEFTHCGIGKKNNFGCAVIVKARDDGSVYGLNKATLENVRLFNLIIKNCNNGIIAGEPGKNNAGPFNINISECYLISSYLYNLTSHILSDISCHNNAWLSTYGPSASDTQKNSSGEILIYTWIKNNIDRKSWIGFQSDSIVWFDKNSGSLQKAFDVTIYDWTLFIQDKYYSGNYSVASKINLWPENIVQLNVLHLKNLADITLLKNDLYISDSIIMHQGAMFFTGKSLQLELSDSCIIQEADNYVIQGKVRTYRNIKSNKTENFGGMGVKITSAVNSSFPDNNVVIIRTTGILTEISKKQVLRTYQIITHKSCGWLADVEFGYDNQELINVKNDYNIQLMRSYNNGQNWILSGGTTDTSANIIQLSDADVLYGLWSFSDSNGVSFPAGLVANPSITHIRCFADSNGAVKIKPDGGFPPYNILWSTGEKSLKIESLKAGVYSVTITDTAGCMLKDTYEIKEPDEIRTSFKVKNLLCFGDSNGSAEVKITGGIPPYIISWQDGGKTSLIKNKKAGVYHLLINDSNKCSKSDSVQIFQNTKIDFGLQVTNISCKGKNDGQIKLSLSGATPPYLVFWSNGQSGLSVKNLKPGKYDFTVFDSFFCSTSDTVMIYEPDVLKLGLTKSNLKCFNDNSGEIVSQVSGGTKPYKYIWNTLDTTPDLKNCSSKLYKLTVADSNFCSARDSVYLSQPQKITFNISILPDTNFKCKGRAISKVSGGSKPYLYEWNDPLKQNSAVATGLCSGFYKLLLTDSALCKADTVIEIKNVINQSAYNSEILLINVYPNPFNTYLIIENFEGFPVEIIISDVLGKTLYYSAGEASVKIDTSLMPSGVYLIQIKINNQIKAFRVIKE